MAGPKGGVGHKEEQHLGGEKSSWPLLDSKSTDMSKLIYLQLIYLPDWDFQIQNFQIQNSHVQHRRWIGRAAEARTYVDRSGGRDSGSGKTRD